MSTTNKETTESKNHGRLATPVLPAAAEQPYTPPELHGVLTFGLGYEAEAKLYGFWKVRILQPVRVRGIVMRPGDVCEVPGTDAIELTMAGQGEFMDPRRGKMEALQIEAAKLGVPLRARDIAKGALDK